VSKYGQHLSLYLLSDSDLQEWAVNTETKQAKLINEVSMQVKVGHFFSVGQAQLLCTINSDDSLSVYSLPDKLVFTRVPPRDIQYTSAFGIQNTVYCGNSQGSLLQFETLTGLYIKEIPLQSQTFNKYKLGAYLEPAVSSI